MVGMRIDKPCPDGSAIRATDGSLHCSLCESRVIDLREVTKRRAEALVAAARLESDRVCVRMFTDRHGHPSFLLEPVRPRARLPLAEVALLATLAGACGASGSAATETQTTVEPQDPPAQACGRATPQPSTSGSETPQPPPTEMSRETPSTPRPQTSAPRDHPPEEMVDGGLG